MLMKNIRQSCIEYLQREDIKHDLKAIIGPIVNIIYNEMYPYLWMICIYHVFLIFIILANLFLLLRLLTGLAKHTSGMKNMEV
jgi:hypothetical protein